MATPEAEARQQMDAALAASGWLVQDYKALNLGAGQGIAIREVPLKSGRCDYLLLVDRRPVGVIEARRKLLSINNRISQTAKRQSQPFDFLPSSSRLDRAAFGTLNYPPATPPDRP